jgi:AmmeMemoRadiSam system protein B
MENSENKAEIREPVVAGSFYTADPKALSKQIKEFLDAVPAMKVGGEIIALISPHAGYIYSGQVAAYAYKLLLDKHFDTVIVIAPSHHVYFQGASIYSKGAFRTPLGIIPVDEDISQKIMKENPAITFMPGAHTQEHSLEVQLPGILNSYPLLWGTRIWRTVKP